jgi:preprotein translocase subunit SecF
MEKLYNKYYKILIFIPVILFLISILIIANFYSNNGDFVKKDVTLTGGLSTTINIEKEIDIVELGNILKNEFKDSDIFLRKLSEFGSNRQIGIIIEASDLKEVDLKPFLEKELDLELTEKNYSVEEAGGSLGDSFYNQMIKAILIAFVLMGIVVFMVFRTLIPSLAVISAALFDIVITISIIDLLGIRLSTAGISALLLLIGYSVDTDILLTTRVLKRKEGSVNERLISSMKTGLTMTVTTLAALSVGYIVTTSPVLKQMFMIILIGLVIDVFATYLTNAGILKWYVERKGL